MRAIIRNVVLASVVFAAGAFAIDPALLKLLPPDAAVVTGINVEQSKNSPFGRYLLEQIAEDERELLKLQATTGFDPRRDLREAVFAVGNGDHRAMFAAKGMFDQSRILTAARQDGAQTLVYQGLNVIAGKNPNSDGWVAFLDSTTVIGGKMDLVKAAIAQRSTNPNQPYLASAQDLGNRYDAWVLTTQPDARFWSRLPNNRNGELMRSVQAAKGGVKFGINVQIDGHAVARSDKDAVALHDVLRFVAGMVQLNREKPEADQIATLLDSMQVKTDANTVSFTLSIPEIELEKLIQMNRRHARRAPVTI